MSAYYIDTNQEVHTYTCVYNGIQLDDGRVIKDPESRRLFAVHPSQSQFCRLVDGVWCYKGVPIEKSTRLDERAWVDGHGLIMVPDIKLPPSGRHTYRPMRGYSGSLAVEENGEIIGWVSVSDLGYYPPRGARDWMRDTNYVIQGDGWKKVDG